MLRRMQTGQLAWAQQTMGSGSRRSPAWSSRARPCNHPTHALSIGAVQCTPHGSVQFPGLACGARTLWCQWFCETHNSSRAWSAARP